MRSVEVGVRSVKDVNVQSQLFYEMQSKLAERNCLLETTDKVCGCTKGRPKHRETWWWNDKDAKVVEDM